MIEGNLYDLIIARGYWLMWRRLTPCEIVGMSGGSDDRPSSKFLRQRAVQIRVAPARLFNEVTRLAVGVASGVV